MKTNTLVVIFSFKKTGVTITLQLHPNRFIKFVTYITLLVRHFPANIPKHITNLTDAHL